MMAARRRRSDDDLRHVSRSDAPGRMLPPEAHARQHGRVRAAHETELVEDYVELIADLQHAQGEARPADIARRFGVTQATVHNMVKRLVDQGLATKEPYRAVFLTGDGERMAAESRRRHAIVLDFLRAAGVGESAAHQDAEGIEHHVSEETLDALARLTGKLRGE